mmetsp:Transcript_14638/g.37387  ORF Transcript_14638/g.37387 Transcript_14638/m.37387 type:complete len:783 (-) Transcript_14638:348-2696(-)
MASCIHSLYLKVKRWRRQQRATAGGGGTGEGKNKGKYMVLNLPLAGKRRFRQKDLILITLLLVFAVAFTLSSIFVTANRFQNVVAQCTVGGSNAVDVGCIYNSLSLRQKIGQLLLLRTDGTAKLATIKRVLQSGLVSGVMLRSRKLRTLKFAEDMKGLNLAILKEGSRGAFGIPSVIAGRFEGGGMHPHQSIHGNAAWPTSLAVAATRNETLAYQFGLRFGQEALKLGYNMAIAPNLDFQPDVNDDIAPLACSRSFGTDIDVATNIAKAVTKGFVDSGIIAVPKHFPSISPSAKQWESKKEKEKLYSDDRSSVEIGRTSLRLFANAFEEKVPAVMTSHTFIPSLNARSRPASLSPNVVDGLLRNDLGFDGVVVTDHLSEEAWESHFHMTLPDAAVESWLAGGDLLIVSSAELVDHYADVADDLHLLTFPRQRPGFFSYFSSATGGVINASDPSSIPTLEYGQGTVTNASRLEKGIDGFVDQIESMVKNGSLPLDILERAVKKVLKMKVKHLYDPASTLLTEDEREDGEGEAREKKNVLSSFSSVSEEIVKQSATLFSHLEGATIRETSIPLDQDKMKGKLLVVGPGKLDPELISFFETHPGLLPLNDLEEMKKAVSAEDDPYRYRFLGTSRLVEEMVRRGFKNTRLMSIPDRPSEVQRMEVYRESNREDVSLVLLLVHAYGDDGSGHVDCRNYEEQISLATGLVERQTPVVLIVLDNPHVIKALPPFPTTLVLYPGAQIGHRNAMSILADILTGKEEANGFLPVRARFLQRKGKGKAKSQDE